MPLSMPLNGSNSIDRKPSFLVLSSAVPKSKDCVFGRGLRRRRVPAADRMADEAVAILERYIKDPTRGLPEPLFRLVSGLVPMVNVDLLIRNRKGETLLTWREDDFYSPGWHIPGGIVRYKESMGARIRAVARKELSVRVRFDPVPLTVMEVVTPRQRIRGHFISFLFSCSLVSRLPESSRFAGGAPQPGQWAWHVGCPRAFLDCQRMYRPFLRRQLATR